MGGEGIFHFGAIRLRVVGNGNLRLTWYSLDKIKSEVLNPLSITATNATEPTKLSNFNQQRAKLRIETTAINEWFQIHKIVIFAKPVASSYPNG